jgi:hypothetical protein
MFSRHVVDKRHMPLVKYKDGYAICLGNNEYSQQCGFKAGMICGGCEDYWAKLKAPELSSQGPVVGFRMGNVTSARHCNLTENPT